LDGLQKQNKGKEEAMHFKETQNSCYRETQILMIVYCIWCIESSAGNNIGEILQDNVPLEALT
jgi:hypothetical protein